MANNEEKNYYRLITLVVKVGTKTLRHVFTKHIPSGQTLEQFLTSQKKKIDGLNRCDWRDMETDKSKKRVLTDPQFKLLTEKPPNLDKFDISLLVIILRNLCKTVEPPVKGWNVAAVPSSETTEGGYILRICEVRNKVVGHEAYNRVTDSNFTNNWSKVVMSLYGLLDKHADKKLKEEIEKDIKDIEKLQISSNAEVEELKQLEATMKTWHMHEMHMKLQELNNTACEQTETLNTVLKEVKDLRNYFQQSGSNTIDNAGHSFQSNQTPQPYNFTTVIDKYMKQTEAWINNEYGMWVAKSRGQSLEGCQRQEVIKKNPNALSETEIIEFANEIGGNWETLAINLGYRQRQIEMMKEMYPRQIENLIRNMIQKWHDTVALCDSENPRDLLASAFANVGDNLTARKVLRNERDLSVVRKLKPRGDIKKKIEAITFDVACPSGVIAHGVVHVFHHYLPALQDVPNTGPIIQEISEEIDSANNSNPAIMDFTESNSQ